MGILDTLCECRGSMNGSMKEIVERARTENASLVAKMENDYYKKGMPLQQFLATYGYDSLTLAIIGQKWGV